MFPFEGKTVIPTKKALTSLIIVCYGEYQEMKALVGAERALKVMQFCATDHYRSILKLVLDHEADIGPVLERHRLCPPL